MDTWTKEFVTAIAQQRNVFVNPMNAQLDELKEMHVFIQTATVDEQGQIRNIFVAELKTNAEINAADHHKTRVELRDSVILEAAVLRQEMETLRTDTQYLIEEAMRLPARKDIALEHRATLATVKGDVSGCERSKRCLVRKRHQTLGTDGEAPISVPEAMLIIADEDHGATGRRNGGFTGR